MVVIYQEKEHETRHRRNDYAKKNHASNANEENKMSLYDKEKRLKLRHHSLEHQELELLDMVLSRQLDTKSFFAQVTPLHRRMKNVESQIQTVHDQILEEAEQFNQKLAEKYRDYDEDPIVER